MIQMTQSENVRHGVRKLWLYYGCSFTCLLQPVYCPALFFLRWNMKHKNAHATAANNLSYYGTDMSTGSGISLISVCTACYSVW